jgi:hypothetical protein
MAAALLALRVGGNPTVPWARRRASVLARGWRSLVWTLAVPGLLAGFALDRTVVRFLARRHNRGNAYRVLARREDLYDG